MSDRIVLASRSLIRQTLLRNAGVDFDVKPVRVDETAIRAAMQAEGATPHDIADALAEAKARRGSARDPDALVLGCDQVLNFKGEILSKPTTKDQARTQLDLLNGASHQLLSAAVIYQDNQPVWRHVGVVRLAMRASTSDYLDDYLDRNWPDLADSLGGYKLESEGVRLFHRIEGDYFTVLGLPLLELLGYLSVRGTIPG